MWMVPLSIIHAKHKHMPFEKIVGENCKILVVLLQRDWECKSRNDF